MEGVYRRLGETLGVHAERGVWLGARTIVRREGSFVIPRAPWTSATSVKRQRFQVVFGVSRSEEQRRPLVGQSSSHRRCLPLLLRGSSLLLPLSLHAHLQVLQLLVDCSLSWRSRASSWALGGGVAELCRALHLVLLDVGIVRVFLAAGVVSKRPRRERGRRRLHETGPHRLTYLPHQRGWQRL